LGDTGKFISGGQQRIGLIEDYGTLSTSVQFAAGDASATIRGYAPGPPSVTVSGGFAQQTEYDAGSHLFTIILAPAPGQHTVDLALSVH
jgi:hypothetical protein